MRNITLLSIAGASTVAMAIIMAATTLIVLPRNAAATPVFAQQTGLPCGQCHENSVGGGKLREFGQKFQAKVTSCPANERGLTSNETFSRYRRAS